MEQFINDVEEAITRDEKLSRKLAHGIFVGPPGSGKSSLMDRLLGRRRRLSTSTGVAEQIVVVHVDESNPSTFHSITLLDGDKWEEIDYNLSLFHQIDESIDPSVPSPKPAQAPLPEKTIPTPEIASSVATSSFLSQPAPEPKPSPVSSSIAREVFGSLVKKHGNYKRFKHSLKKSFSLYLRDTGGQVEFQEMLCLLVCGPSLFFFVFRLDLDFKAKFETEYRESTGESSNYYTSSITTEEAFLQCLASVYAMGTGDAGVKIHKPLVFIVGTHKDRLGASADEKIAEFDHTLHNLIEKNGFGNLVQYAGRGKVIFTVDNNCDGEEDFGVIRSSVQTLIRSRNDFIIEYPISYLLFCLELQKQNCSVLSLGECKRIAAKCGIEGEQVLHLLEFLHLRIGVIRYFDKDGVRHVVIKEPQVLFNKVTDLIVRTFSSKSLYTSEKMDFEKKGIMTASAFESVVGDKDDISAEDFLKILEHLRLVASFTTRWHPEKRYFIPSVLNHVPESQEEELVTDVLPLAIRFKCNHCPKGLFSVLVTHLMTPETDSDTDSSITTTFTLKEDKIYKDQVSFDVLSPGVQDEVSLKAHVSHLEMKFYPDLNTNRFSSVELVCSNICQILEAAIHSSLKDLHYSESNVKPSFCLRCENCSELHPVKKETGKCQIYCAKVHKTLPIPLHGKCWYSNGKCLY